MAVDPSPERFRDLMLGDEPGLEEVMACVFGIQKHEVRTYQTLLRQPREHRRGVGRRTGPRPEQREPVAVDAA